ncbi:MAG: aminotransferase class V-fold PLP-dependent enzyme, partial [Ktedonobacterales bacterium]
NERMAPTVYAIRRQPPSFNRGLLTQEMNGLVTDTLATSAAHPTHSADRSAHCPPLAPLLRRIALGVRRMWSDESDETGGQNATDVILHPAPNALARTLESAVAEPLARLAQATPENADDEDEATQVLRAALFPVTAQHTYLNHAAVGPLPAPVESTLHALLRGLSLYGSAVMDGYPAETLARARYARLINAPPRCVAFTKNVSDAFMTIAAGLHWQAGDNVVTAEIEFPANVYPWLNLAEQGVETRFVAAREGRVAFEDVAACIDERTRLVSLSFVEFGTGFRNNLERLAALAHARGALFAVDGIQGMGALQLDVTASDIDFLASGSAKWLLSPAHVGMLYVRPSLLDTLRVARRGWQSVATPFDFFDYAQSLREDAGRFEGGSNNFVGLVSLAAALVVFEAAGMAQIEARTLALADLIRAGLRERGHTLISPAGAGERSGILCFRPRSAGNGSEADMSALVARLTQGDGVMISARNGLARVSPHFYNTRQDVARFLAALDRALA